MRMEVRAMSVLTHVLPDAVWELSEESGLRARVSAEFREMPGLMITIPQAARLFSIDRARCQRVLDLLVAMGELSTDGQIFCRTGTGRRFQ
jgi:hypothetical protein